MNALSRNPKIIAMARGLGLSADDAAQNILSFCRSRVARLLKSAASVQMIWDFEKVVCSHLNLVIHEIWNDEELREFSLRYARDEGDSKFAALSSFRQGKDTSLFEIIDAFERRVIIEMLEQTGWSQTDAADNFKIPLSTLNQKIKRHGIEIKKKRERSAAGVPTAK